MSTYQKVILKARPRGEIVPDEVFEVIEELIPTEDDVPEGSVLIKADFLSLDPTLRGQISGVDSYVKAVEIGAVMRGWGLATVVVSRNSNYEKGDSVFGVYGFSEYAIHNTEGLRKVIVPPGINAVDFCGVLGMTGLTAYMGLFELAGGVNPGQKVVVSGAAGATGSVVGQIAKLKGAYVIGIAGSDEKCNVLTNELGFDVALNYKLPTFEEDFKNLTKEGFDIYWDNVGGKILDLALLQASNYATFVMCGAISAYNSVGPPPGISNYFHIVTKRLILKGLIVRDYSHLYEKALNDLTSWVLSGKIKSKNTVVSGRMKDAPNALASIFKGVNTGKLVLRIEH
ncbi:NADP-dependent leukotriene B4 12-hydroxydehydrogenase [Nadsonia fulvescens var. elongata DSM 6958]|uniref:NADP-dependent leukotriene B4 12-hydroxydehydrogenase n=1 Tax=Nadsonia fulvescens var. elongata DSM 6958 TaxID=857566 RepID=A0A1E3PRL5_9ASCO|nr:NADP-dependent leukotriene B4 12-hydroxydehydrogenase [Nadsonia fulvescens var. elongata DSM 6958]